MEGRYCPGCLDKKEISLIDVFVNYRHFQEGDISTQTYEKIIAHACPGRGSCGAMYTANTMASAIAAMGLSLPYSASNPADSAEKLQECANAGAVMRVLLEKDIKPLDIMTREAFENAMVLTTALGGSTNVVLHLIAVAHAANISLTIDDFTAISARTPLIADMLPFGRYNMVDLHKVGGIPAVMKLLLEAGLLHGDCLTITGKTLRKSSNGSVFNCRTDCYSPTE